jgi:hypothetical protein
METRAKKAAIKKADVKKIETAPAPAKN